MKFRVEKPGFAELETKVSAIAAAYHAERNPDDRAYRIRLETACVNAGWTLAEFYTEQDRRH